MHYIMHCLGMHNLGPKMVLILKSKYFQMSESWSPSIMIIQLHSVSILHAYPSKEYCLPLNSKCFRNVVGSGVHFGNGDA